MESDEDSDNKVVPNRQCGEEELRGFLRRLSHDPWEAGERYNRIRRKLILLFEGHRGAARYAVELGDKALDRTARLVCADPEIMNIEAYAFSVGRYVLKEFWKKRTFEVAVADPPDTPAAVDEPAIRLMCLRRCLSTIPAKDRELILTYYEGEKSDKIAERQKIAAKLDLSAEALRIRVFRIRRELEGCIERAMNSPSIRNVSKRNATPE